MPANYEVYLLAPDSDYVLAYLPWGASADAAATGNIRTAIGWLEYTNVVNSVGSWRMGLPYPQFDASLARLDARLVVWRKPAGGARYLDFAGFVRTDPVDFYQRGDELYMELRGVCGNFDLKRREIMAYSGTAGANKSGPADDVMKEYVYENLGAGAAPDRNITAQGFTIQADLSQGTLIDRAASYQNLLDTLQKVSADSHSIEATSVYFGCVPLGSGWYSEFRTRICQWGNDHRHPSGTFGVTGAQGPIVIGLDRQNLDNASLLQDRVDEATVVFGLGQGEGADRNIQIIFDNARRGASPRNWIEVSVNANNAATNAEVLGAAQARLRDGRPKRTFSGALVGTTATQYGMQWGFGDFLTAIFAGTVLDCRVDAVTVRIAGRDETISAQLRSEAYVEPVMPT
jgi:hypothetical protein